MAHKNASACIRKNTANKIIIVAIKIVVSKSHFRNTLTPLRKANIHAIRND